MSVLADDPTFLVAMLNARWSAKGDNGLSIDRVRYSRKTGRWLASLS